MKIILFILVVIPTLGFGGLDGPSCPRPAKIDDNKLIQGVVETKESFLSRLKKLLHPTFCKSLYINSGNSICRRVFIEDIGLTFTRWESKLSATVMASCEKLHGKGNCKIHSNERGFKFLTFYLSKDSVGAPIGDKDDVYYLKICATKIQN